MALSEAALCLRTDVETELGIAANADPRIDGWIEDASEAISLYLRGGKERLLHRQAAIVEAFGGDGFPFQDVSVVPINSITAVTFNGSALASTDYEIHNADAGLIYFPGRPPFNTNYIAEGVARDRSPGTARRLFAVTYDGGWVTPAQAANGSGSPFTLQPVTLPRSISRACVELVGYMKQHAPTPGRGRTASIGVLAYNESFVDDDGADGEATYGIPASIRAKIRSFRFTPGSP